MSVRWLTTVWERSQARGTERLVLLALADVANVEGECWPGVDYLADRCKVSSRTVIRALDALDALGEIERTRRGYGKTKITRLTVGQTCQSVTTVEAPISDTGVTSNSDSSVTTVPYIQPSEEPSVEPESESEASEVPTLGPVGPRRDKRRTDPLSDVVTRKHWDACQEKPTLRYVALRAIVDKFLKAGYAEAVILEALGRCHPVYTQNSLAWAMKQVQQAEAEAEYDCDSWLTDVRVGD